MSMRITRRDSDEIIGRDDDQIQMDKVMKKASMGTGGKAVSPQELIALMNQRDSVQSGISNYAESNINLEKSITEDTMANEFDQEVSHGVDKVSALVEKAKQRLATISKTEGRDITADQKKRYEIDKDTGRESDEKRSKDNYVEDYPKGRDYLKKLKSNMTLKLNKISNLLSSISTKEGSEKQEIETNLKVLGAQIRRSLSKISSVEEDVRMKKVTYPVEPDAGRTFDKQDVKDRDPKVTDTTINKSLEKMWSLNKNIKLARDKSQSEEPILELPDEKSMGGSDMKKLPLDKPEKEKADAPKGKVDEKGNKEVIKELEEVIKSLSKADEDFSNEIKKIEKAIEGLKGKPEDKQFGKKDEDKKDKKESKPKKEEKKEDEEIGEMGEPVKSKKQVPDMKPIQTGISPKKENPFAKKSGLTAIFNRMPTKLASYWEVKDGNNETMLRSACSDIYGKDTFKQWNWVSSKNYGELLCSKIRENGLQYVASVMGTKVIMTKQASLFIKQAGERTPALKSKINEKEYYNKAYGEKDYGSKSTKMYMKKSSVEDINTQKKIAELNEKLSMAEKENEILNTKLTQEEENKKKMEKENAQNAEKAANLSKDKELRIRANKAIALASTMVEKGFIVEALKDETIDSLMLMDDVSFSMEEKLTNSKASLLGSVGGTKNSKGNEVKRIGGLGDGIIAIASKDVDENKTFKGELESLWTKKQ